MLQGEVAEAAKELITRIAAEEGIQLLECESVIDHVHLLLRVGEKSELSRAMNMIKGSTARLLFERFPGLRLDAGVNHFWQHRYGARVVPHDAEEAVSRYIVTQGDRLEKYERL